MLAGEGVVTQIESEMVEGRGGAGFEIRSRSVVWTRQYLRQRVLSSDSSSKKDTIECSDI